MSAKRFGSSFVSGVGKRGSGSVELKGARGLITLFKKKEHGLRFTALPTPTVSSWDVRVHFDVKMPVTQHGMLLRSTIPQQEV